MINLNSKALAMESKTLPVHSRSTDRLSGELRFRIVESQLCSRTVEHFSRTPHRGAMQISGFSFTNELHKLKAPTRRRATCTSLPTGRWTLTTTRPNANVGH